MRIWLSSLVLALGLSPVRAQVQERKLIDRLLRPDTELQNSAQDKKVITPGRAIEKKANVSSFYIQKRPVAKGFDAAREFSGKEFAARHFRDGQMPAIVQARTQLAKPARIDPRSSRSLRDAAGSRRKVVSFRFPGDRPFLEQGKSQKSLSRQNPPLTIDQVRELLNKND